MGCQKQHWKEGGHKQNCVAEEERSVEKAAAMKSGGASGGRGGAAAAAEDHEEGGICAICQYPLSEEPCTKMPCSHVYHVACVEKLRSYDIKQVCPTCRVDLPPGPQQVWEEAARRWVLLDRRYGQGEDKPWRRITSSDDRREAAEVVRMMTEAGEQGHAGAQSTLGLMYEQGKGGLPQSDALAVEWYRKAADQGYAPALSILGVMYREGRGGLPQSGALAVEWYRKAAEQGSLSTFHPVSYTHLTLPTKRIV